MIDPPRRPTAPPTILQLIPRLDAGGAEATTLEIVEALVAAGARALVATDGGRGAGEVTRLGGELVPFPAATKNPARLVANAVRLARLVRAEDVGVIHARSRAPAWSGLVAARRTGVAFVTTYHGAYGTASALKNVYNGIMARGDIVIANSGFTRNLILGRHRVAPEQIRVVPRGVDLISFDPARIAPERVARLRAAWSVAADRPLLLHAARLTGWKGQSVVIEAARLLKARGALGGLVFVLAGDPQGRSSHVASLRRAIAGAGLDDAVRLVGHCDDMPAAFLTATATIVASSEPEAFGRAVTEASAMGSPVIATAHGAPAETVITEGAGRTGWLVPPANAEALARAIETAMSLGSDERATLAVAARRHVAVNYSKPTLQRQTLAVYDELLGTTLAAEFEGTTSMPRLRQGGR